MRYRVTALTPFLVGDGQKLSPIDYMVWKNQINVLDQRRIFRLLARGPRLEGYLAQLRKAETLDFASWGGFAQNYAERRILFEHAGNAAVWQATRPEFLFIPTFSAGPRGPYLPASALKGALRTGVASARWNDGVLREMMSRAGDRLPRRPGEAAESMTLGSGQNDPLRVIAAGDSDPISAGSFRIYLVRSATLVERGPKLELGWKQSLRGQVPGNRPEDGTPTFVEMAPPGVSFTGDWRLRAGNSHRNHVSHDRVFQSVNEHAANLLQEHVTYAQRAGLGRLETTLQGIGTKITDARTRRDACVLNLGWGGGFLSKTGFLDTANEDYRKLLRGTPAFERAIRTGLPFPKTRRVIFEQGQPSSLAGWVLLEVVRPA